MYKTGVWQHRGQKKKNKTFPRNFQKKTSDNMNFNFIFSPI